MFHIKKNKEPPLKYEKMVCDDPLCEHLKEYEVLDYLNKHSCNIFLGKPRSGKTTLLNSLFSNKKGLKGIYHDIYLFQPSHSRNSMKKNIWEKGIKNENKYDELNDENLLSALDKIKSQDSKYDSCIIFDDVTATLSKNKQIIDLLKELCYNRRQYRVSIFFLVQSFKAIPLQIRMVVDNLFIFRVSKQTMESLFETYLEDFNPKLIPKLTKEVYDGEHNFLFINTVSQKLYKNWDEIIFLDE